MCAICVASIRSRAGNFHDRGRFLNSFLRLLCGNDFLFLILLTVVKNGRAPIHQLRPHLRTRISTAHGEVVRRYLIPIRRILRPHDRRTLLYLIMYLPILRLRLASIGTGVPTLRYACVGRTELRLRKAGDLRCRIVASFQIPSDHDDRYGRQRVVTRDLFRDDRMTPRRPVIRTRLLTPHDSHVHLVSRRRASTTLTCGVLGIMERGRFQQRVRRVGLPLARLPMGLRLLFQQWVKQNMYRARVPRLLRAFRLICGRHLREKGRGNGRVVLLPRVSNEGLRRREFSKTNENDRRSVICLHFAFPDLFDLRCGILCRLSLQGTRFLFSLKRIVMGLGVAGLFMTMDLLWGHICNFTTIFERVPFLRVQWPTYYYFLCVRCCYDIKVLGEGRMVLRP